MCLMFVFSCTNEVENIPPSDLASKSSNHLSFKQIKSLASLLSVDDLSCLSAYERQTRSTSSAPKEIDNFDFFVTQDGDTLMFCINYKNDRGFMVFSTDCDQFPLLAHSDKGRFSFEVSISNPLNLWVYEKKAIIQNSLNNNTITNNVWNDLGNPEYSYEIERVYDFSNVQTRGRRTVPSGKTNIHPFSGMSLEWGQGTGYNYYASGNLAGCPAVSIGMLMWDLYWRIDYSGPAPGSFEFPVWDCPTKITQNGPNSVARLLKNIADSIPEYIWGPSFSGASGNNTIVGLKRIGFPSATIKAYNFEEVYQNIYQKKHGLILSGTKAGVGHMWFCDGYQEIIYKVQKKDKKGKVISTWYEYEDALYMNWGSDGADNGWYESTGLNGFTYGAGMIVNLDWAPNN